MIPHSTLLPRITATLEHCTLYIRISIKYDVQCVQCEFRCFLVVREICNLFFVAVEKFHFKLYFEKNRNSNSIEVMAQQQSCAG